MVEPFPILLGAVDYFLCNHLNRKNLFAVSIANTGMDLSGHPSVKEADIIHLHWINQGFLSVSNLGKLINSGKPIVWTLHDLWPATAICHYPDKCKNINQNVVSVHYKLPILF